MKTKNKEEVMGVMSKKEFIEVMEENMAKLRGGNYFFTDLQAGYIFGNSNYGEIQIPLANGVSLKASLYDSTESEKENPIIEEKRENELPLVFSRNIETLAEISIVFGEMRAGCPELNQCDSRVWKQNFIVWANEFEERHKNTDWNDKNCIYGDYEEAIEEFARKKITEYAGLEVA